MSYALFHLLFNVPLLIALWWFARKRMTATHWKWIGVVCLIVLAFTFPWDNHAVGKGIWNFPEERVLLRIDNLPIEEICFFLFETLAVCLLVVLFLPRRREG